MDLSLILIYCFVVAFIIVAIPVWIMSAIYIWGQLIELLQSFNKQKGKK